MHRLCGFLLLALVPSLWAAPPLALYDFSNAEGAIVRDRSGSGQPLDLRIADPKKVARKAGSLEIKASTSLKSEKPARKITDAVRRSGAFAIEAWLAPANTEQEGPARIVSISKDTQVRNVTLGQEKTAYDFRFRVGNEKNGIPSLPTPGGRVRKGTTTHVVVSRSSDGTRRIYLDGREVAKDKRSGKTNEWDENLPLVLGNELTGDRPWLGILHRVAIYDQPLSAEEVKARFEAGSEAPFPDVEELRKTTQKEERARHFETAIAPLLAEHCLHCHEPANRKGKLDLARRKEALAGGDEGPAIVPGKAHESLLWELVESDEMPKKEEPLSPEEKKLLREWIDDGATWSLDFIDPAVYAHGAHAAENWIRRLTVDEYIETVRTAIGVDLEKEARELLPRDLRADGFQNTAYNLGVDLEHIEAFRELAALAVSRLDVPKFVERFSRERKFTDKSMGALIEKMGAWVLRGEIDKTELIALRGITTKVASAGGDFDEAMRYMLEAMLQSPRFLYRVEEQVGDGTLRPAASHELATRLSYLVWGGPPDARLWEAAQKGDLAGGDRLGKEISRLLGDERARRRSVQFLEGWLNLGRLDSLSPGKERYPDWDPRLAAEMRAETIAFFEDAVWERKRPLAELLNAEGDFASPELARHYGKGKRAGILSHGSVLTIGGDDASMVTRGLFVLHELLRGVVKDPPPGTDVTPVPSKPGWTQRRIGQQRIDDKSCGGCHNKFEPLAFGLERFDGLGRYRETDRFGNTLREDGEILFPGEEKAIAFQSATELADLLAGSPRVQESLTWKLVQFALGRPLGASDAREVSAIHEAAMKGGGTYQATILAIAASDLVQQTRTEVTE